MGAAGYSGQTECTASRSRGQKPFLRVTLSVTVRVTVKVTVRVTVRVTFKVTVRVTSTGTAFHCCNSQYFLPSQQNNSTENV